MKALALYNETYKRDIEQDSFTNHFGLGYSRVKVNEEEERIEVELGYQSPNIEVNGKRYGIYDHRPKRTWRHLDLWQYKTYISASLPRYKDEHGFYHSIEVPWVETGE